MIIKILKYISLSLKWCILYHTKVINWHFKHALYIIGQQ